MLGLGLRWEELGLLRLRGGGVKVIGVGLDFDYCQILGGVNIRCLFLTSK